MSETGHTTRDGDRCQTTATKKNLFADDIHTARNGDGCQLVAGKESIDVDAGHAVSHSVVGDGFWYYYRARVRIGVSVFIIFISYRCLVSR